MQINWWIVLKIRWSTKPDIFCVRFEVFTSMTVKNTVFLDAAPCRSCVNRRFGGTYRLRLQAKNPRERGTSWFHIPEDGILQIYSISVYTVDVNKLGNICIAQ
jgi:hypothetical protein